MRPYDLTLYEELKEKITSYSETFRECPGIRTPLAFDCFLKQIIDSIRRIKYVTTIKNKPISQTSTDPLIDTFDPLKASIWHYRNNNFDEACWLIFLAIHFGKSSNSGWSLMRSFYNRLGNHPFWEWSTIIHNRNEFRIWLNANRDALHATGKFGNHRKYESLNAYERTGTGSAIASYINWVDNFGNHNELFQTMTQNEDNPQTSFNSLYKSMDSVLRFGRTAKFDYLTMIGKLGYAEIIPGSTYMSEATGPLRGARLLFQNRHESNLTVTELHNIILEFEDHMTLYFGMQVLEDALCNWQKSPFNYVYFGG